MAVLHWKAIFAVWDMLGIWDTFFLFIFFLNHIFDGAFRVAYNSLLCSPREGHL